MGDLIDRQAAIDALGGNEPVGDPSKMDDDDVIKMWERIRIINIINKLPSAQPEPQWIPCSKTIDIPDHEVLCCDRHGEELIGWLSYIDDQWLCESDGEMMYNPVAWRGKPEPYREEGEEDDSN